MMGVMEEKTNRIAEVIVSSVRPFQLMLGKIIGIGMVALTQFLLWIAFMFIIYNVTNLPEWRTVPYGWYDRQYTESFYQYQCTVDYIMLYFLSVRRFFFYSSLYAAIGSAVNEDMREAQSLSFPITMLVIFSIAYDDPLP